MSAARSGCSAPTARCSTRSPAAASTTPAATPPTAPGCRSGTATAAPAQKFSVNGGGPTNGPGGKCVDVAAGDDSGGNGTAVQLWDCQSFAVDQHWRHNSNGSLDTLGRCLDINGNGTANGTAGRAVGLQRRRRPELGPAEANGSLLNPQSGRCLDDPSGNTANGTRLQICDCNGSAAQEFALN